MARRALDLRCSYNLPRTGARCGVVAPLLCEGRLAGGEWCGVAVCGAHRARGASRWLCPTCAPAQPSPPQPQLSLVTT